MPPIGSTVIRIVTFEHDGQRVGREVLPSGTRPKASRTVLPGTNLFRIGVSIAMNTLYDQTEKSGAHRLLVTSLLERRGQVKSASEKPFEVDGNVVPRFADKVANMWPLISANAIIESAASIELQRHDIPDLKYARLMEEVHKAASLFQCLADVADARHAVDEETRYATDTVKQAGPQWALPETGEFPIQNKDATENSIEVFCIKRAAYPYPWRVKAASALLDAADRQGATVLFECRNMLDASAGNGFGLPIPVAREIAHRASKIAHRDPGLAVQMYEHAVDLAGSKINDPEELRKTMKSACSAMDMIDDKFDLRGDYGRELSFPEDVAFHTTTTKIAAAQDVFINIGDYVYLKSEVATVKAAAFRVVSPEFAAEISNGQFVDPDKLSEHAKIASPSVLSRVMHGFGVKPVQATEHNQASIIPCDEMSRWANIAGEMGSDLKDHMGDGVSFTFPKDQTDRVGVDTAFVPDRFREGHHTLGD